MFDCSFYSSVSIDAAMSLRWGWPSGAGLGQGSSGDWASLLKHGGFKDGDEVCAYAKNPVANLAPLAAAQIPLIRIKVINQAMHEFVYTVILYSEQPQP